MLKTLGRQIVLDKSYLQAIKKEAAPSFFIDNTVLITSALFYEILTMEDRKNPKGRCVAKFPKDYGAFALLPPVAEYIRIEREKRASASPIINHQQKGMPRINPRWANPDFCFSDDQEAVRQEWKRVVDGDEVDIFYSIATDLPNQIPELSGIDDQHNRKVTCDRIKAEICSDNRNIRKFMNSIGPLDIMNPNDIDSSWVTFRYFQVNLLYSIDHYAKFGLSPLDEKMALHIEHEIHDLEYVIFSSLCGGLATNEKRQGDNFRLVCPEGTIVSH